MFKFQGSFNAHNVINILNLDRGKKKRIQIIGLEVLAVADPGFPRGGGANIRFCQIFPKTFHISSLRLVYLVDAIPTEMCQRKNLFPKLVQSKENC